MLIFCHTHSHTNGQWALAAISGSVSCPKPLPIGSQTHPSVLQPMERSSTMYYKKLKMEGVWILQQHIKHAQQNSQEQA